MASSRDGRRGGTKRRNPLHAGIRLPRSGKAAASDDEDRVRHRINFIANEQGKIEKLEMALQPGVKDIVFMRK